MAGRRRRRARCAAVARRDDDRGDDESDEKPPTRADGSAARTRHASDHEARLGRAGPRAPEIVLDPDDIVELRCRDLDELDPLDRLVAMPSPDRDVGRVPGAQLADLILA